MPPRLPSGIHFRVTNGKKHLENQKRKHRDPYALAQARQRKAANLARQDVLKQQRAASLGDPIRGITTPFVQSFDNASLEPAQSGEQAVTRLTTAESHKEPHQSPADAEQENHLNHYLSSTELTNSLHYSRVLTEPHGSDDPQKEEEEAKRHQILRENAEAAVARIVRLVNGSSKDRTRANVQRCIDTFGRHHTDAHLAPKAPSYVSRDPSLPSPAEKTPRAGPDTGSSEVQVAILTTKIRVLANHLEGEGRQDKVNKRNLRLLVHKRQKLLTYLRRKERGGERWQNLVETLGLTDGTWKGEISL
ncbi:MAG: hypothetical protein M1830_008011 [Pleopsidium flavum]|nr:MAG: hypothetical protein M1830_008011 [Pleopsidium flavum]